MHEPDELIQKLYDFSDQIEKKFSDVESQRILLKDVEKEIEEYRDTIAGRVTNEVDDSGKPRYSNETLRKAETVRRLAEDKKYQGLVKSREVIRENLIRAEAEYEKLKWQQQAVRYHIRLLAAQLVTGYGLEVDGKIAANLKPASEPIESETQEPVKQEQEKTEGMTEETPEFKPDQNVLKGISQAFRQGPISEQSCANLAGQLSKQLNRPVNEEDIVAHLNWLAQRQRVARHGQTWQIVKTA